MRILIEPTGLIATIDGVPCRVWAGETDDGARCRVAIYRLGVEDGETTWLHDAELNLHILAGECAKKKPRVTHPGLEPTNGIHAEPSLFRVEGQTR